MPPLEEARDLAGKMFPDLVGQITTEHSKKIRELVRNAAIRDDRKLTPRELENVASGDRRKRCSRECGARRRSVMICPKCHGGF